MRAYLYNIARAHAYRNSKYKNKVMIVDCKSIFHSLKKNVRLDRSNLFFIVVKSLSKNLAAILQNHIYRYSESGRVGQFLILFKLLYM